ncbi:hypothetical protein [Paludibacterium purpuratum]|uniref:Uncharacterized protein n=1 Tax=Paludibacterium purpuratum TaxID=1144873 RepID=A0A4R7BB21_9NEIS|nr:hypothetical protein [Paludibacterium purpuratum]TDR82170.1 hypothetical protein DFP86_102284 [Paludibacterium purpuratum]
MAITLSKPVSLCYEPQKFRSLLADAFNNASSDWDRTFIGDMIDRHKSYGDNMHLSALQRHHLERIANNLESTHVRKRHHRPAA